MRRPHRVVKCVPRPPAYVTARHPVYTDDDCLHVTFRRDIRLNEPLWRCKRKRQGRLKVGRPSMRKTKPPTLLSPRWTSLEKDDCAARHLGISPDAKALLALLTQLAAQHGLRVVAGFCAPQALRVQTWASVMRRAGGGSLRCAAPRAPPLTVPIYLARTRAPLPSDALSSFALCATPSRRRPALQLHARRCYATAPPSHHSSAPSQPFAQPDLRCFTMTSLFFLPEQGADLLT